MLKRTAKYNFKTHRAQNYNISSIIYGIVQGIVRYCTKSK